MDYPGQPMCSGGVWLRRPMGYGKIHQGYLEPDWHPMMRPGYPELLKKPMGSGVVIPGYPEPRSCRTMCPDYPHRQPMGSCGMILGYPELMSGMGSGYPEPMGRMGPGYSEPMDSSDIRPCHTKLWEKPIGSRSLVTSMCSEDSGIATLSHIADGKETDSEDGDKDGENVEEFTKTKSQTKKGLRRSHTVHFEREKIPPRTDRCYLDFVTMKRCRLKFSRETHTQISDELL